MGTPERLAADLDEIIGAAQDDLQQLRGCQLLITGGTGFFGRWLVESFARANRELQLAASAVVLSRRPQQLALAAPHLARDRSIHFVSADVRELPSGLGRFDYVLHTATPSTAQPEGDSSLHLIDTIVQGTRLVLQQATGGACRGFLFTSSGAVYGRQPRLRVTEDALTGPDCLQTASAYGEAKRMAELLCSVYHQEQGVPVKVARCFAFVGPFLPLHAHFAIGNFLRDAAAGQTIRLTGDGTPRRSYMYASDLCIWLWSMLLRAPAGRAYNVGSDQALSLRYVAGRVARLARPRVAVEIKETPSPRARVVGYVPSIVRARTELGLEPRVGLDDAIRRTLTWLK